MLYKKTLHIILDGVDGSGKTTVCQLLSRRLDLPILKMQDAKKYFQDGSIEKISSFFNIFLTQLEEFSFIQDRGFLSSLVYAEVFKRKDIDYTAIEKYLAVMKPYVFILTTNISDLQKRKDDEIIQPHLLKSLSIEYSKLVSEFNANGYERFYLINTTALSPIDVCNKILDILS